MGTITQTVLLVLLVMGQVQTPLQQGELVTSSTALQVTAEAERLRVKEGEEKGISR